MEVLPTTLIPVLRFLLPGFITAMVFYNLTAHSKPEQFERVVLALIFTFIIQLPVYYLGIIFIYFGKYFSIGTWDGNTEIIWSFLIAIIIGIIASFVSNKNYIHHFLNTLGVTRETSYASVWVGEFSKRVTYIVLHLNDERRLYGWPKEWPTDPVSGHFSIEEPSWLVSKDKNGKKISEKLKIDRVAAMLIRSGDVEWVEFMENSPGLKETQKETDNV